MHAILLNIIFRIMRTLAIIYFLILIASPEISAQLLADKVMPPSPNAAAIIKYCDHPVGIKTGIPKIQFPFQTLINEDVFVPISLNYHSMGVKVEEEASWVGLGWNLSTGGMITRIVRGKNDFGIVEEDLKQTARGYPFEHIKPCYDDCEENETAEFHEKVCNGEIDTDPDLFFFDILGMKGKFFLEPDHNESDEFITINIVKPRKMIFAYNIKGNYWKITDSRKYTYVFKTKELTETHRNYFDHKLDDHKILFKYYSDLATTAWYLDEITSPSGNSTYFTYDVSSESGSTYGSNGTHHRMNINDEDIWDVHYSSYCFPDKMENVQIVSESLFNDVYLKSISSGAYRATFETSLREDIISPSSYNRDRPSGSSYTQHLNPNAGPQKLDAIEIRKNGELVNTYKFHYSYFNNYNEEVNSWLHKRLRLDSLTATKVGNKSKTDAFYYHDQYNLPSKESHARDLWGYFNGEEDLYNIVPSDYFNYSQPEKTFEEEGRTRHYSLEHVKEGVLEKIEYGNGFTKTFKYGHQEFNYVNDDIKSHIDSNLKNSNLSSTHDPFISGGLRIEEIIEKYPTDVVYREYNYTTNKIENGELTIVPYSHEYDGYDHKASGNHAVIYKNVKVKYGKIFNGKKF